MTRSKGTRRSIRALRWLVVAIAGVVLWRALAAADLPRALGLVVAIGPAVAVILVPFVVAMSLDVLGWREVYAGLGRSVPFLPFLGTRIAGEAVLQSLPGGQVVAESMAPYLLQSRCGVPLAEGFAGLALKKLLFTIAHGTLILGGALLGWASLVRISPGLVGGSWLPAVIAAIGATVIVSGAVGIFALLRGDPARRVSELLHLLPIAVVRRFAESRHEAFVATDRHVASAWAGARVPRALALFLAFWLVEAGETWLVLKLLGAPLPVREVLSFEAAISLVRALAFFVPAGLGVQDVAYMAMLRALGVADAVTVGAAFVMLKRAKEGIWIVVGYVLLLGMRGVPAPAET